MKLLQVALSSVNYRAPDAPIDRMAIVSSIAQEAAKVGADGVAFPAGFWPVRREDEIPAITHGVQRLAKKAGVAILGGIDVVRKNSGKSGARPDARLAEPFFGFGIDAFGRLVGPFRQGSSTATNAAAAEDLDPSCRLVRVKGQTVAVLVCGESHNEGYRQAIASVRPNAVVVLGHAGLGQGLVPTITCIARRASCPVIHVQHTKHPAQLHFADRSGLSHPLPAADHLVSPPAGLPWLACAVRKVT